MTRTPPWTRCSIRPASPTAGLDAEGRAVLRAFLAEQGRTVVAATHEMGWFADVAGRAVKIEAGRVAE